MFYAVAIMESVLVVIHRSNCSVVTSCMDEMIVDFYFG